MLRRYYSLPVTIEKVHGTKYSYDKLIFKGVNHYVTITCPIHGDFTQKLSKHLHGQGCKKCATEHTALGARSNTAEFVAKANKMFGAGKYDYSAVVYTTKRVNVTITCNTCNTEFTQPPGRHLAGHGCPNCRYIKISTLNKNRSAEVARVKGTKFAEEAKAIHGDLYEYDKVDYKIRTVPVQIYCNRCKAYFNQSPSIHINSKCGCPSCAIKGFDNNKPGILYYLSINDGQAYKIGITNRSVQERFTEEDLNKITIIQEWYYDKGIDARNNETKILNDFKTNKYYGANLLLNGNTELFNIDVLNLYNKETK